MFSVLGPLCNTVSLTILDLSLLTTALHLLFGSSNIKVAGRESNTVGGGEAKVGVTPSADDMIHSHENP